MESKTPQTISHNHIRINELKSEVKNTKTSRALNFINQFAPEHQLVRQTQQYRIYNRKGKIIIQ